MEQRAPDELGIVTGEAVALDVRATSFPLRAAGALIDFVAELLLLIGLVIAIDRLATAFGTDAAIGRALAIVALVVAFVITPTVVETATRGRSLGKLAVGARVVRDDGGSISARHAFVRALAGILEFVFTFGGLAALVGIFNRRSKRLGDLLAGTVSQHERVPKPSSNAHGVPASLAEWATRADVGRLSDPLARRVASFLAAAPKLLPESRRRLAESLAAEVSPYVAPLPDAEPEMLLAAVAAIRREREYRGLMLEQQRFEKLEGVLTSNPHSFPDR